MPALSPPPHLSARSPKGATAVATIRRAGPGQASSPQHAPPAPPTQPYSFKEVGELAAVTGCSGVQAIARNMQNELANGRHLVGVTRRREGVSSQVTTGRITVISPKSSETAGKRPATKSKGNRKTPKASGGLNSPALSPLSSNGGMYSPISAFVRSPPKANATATYLPMGSPVTSPAVNANNSSEQEGPLTPRAQTARKRAPAMFLMQAGRSANLEEEDVCMEGLEGASSHRANRKPGIKLGDSRSRPPEKNQSDWGAGMEESTISIPTVLSSPELRLKSSQLRFRSPLQTTRSSKPQSYATQHKLKGSTRKAYTPRSHRSTTSRDFTTGRQCPGSPSPTHYSFGSTVKGTSGSSGLRGPDPPPHWRTVFTPDGERFFVHDRTDRGESSIPKGGRPPTRLQIEQEGPNGEMLPKGWRSIRTPKGLLCYLPPPPSIQAQWDLGTQGVGIPIWWEKGAKVLRSPSGWASPTASPYYGSPNNNNASRGGSGPNEHRRSISRGPMKSPRTSLASRSRRMRPEAEVFLALPERSEEATRPSTRRTKKKGGSGGGKMDLLSPVRSDPGSPGDWGLRSSDATREAASPYWAGSPGPRSRSTMGLMRSPTVLTSPTVLNRSMPHTSFAARSARVPSSPPPVPLSPLSPSQRSSKGSKGRKYAPDAEGNREPYPHFPPAPEGSPKGRPITSSLGFTEYTRSYTPPERRRPRAQIAKDLAAGVRSLLGEEARKPKRLNPNRNTSTRMCSGISHDD